MPAGQRPAVGSAQLNGRCPTSQQLLPCWWPPKTLQQHSTACSSPTFRNGANDCAILHAPPCCICRRPLPPQQRQQRQAACALNAVALLELHQGRARASSWVTGLAGGAAIARPSRSSHKSSSLRDSQHALHLCTNHRIHNASGPWWRHPHSASQLGPHRTPARGDAQPHTTLSHILSTPDMEGHGAFSAARRTFSMTAATRSVPCRPCTSSSRAASSLQVRRASASSPPVASPERWVGGHMQAGWEGTRWVTGHVPAGDGCSTTCLAHARHPA